MLHQKYRALSDSKNTKNVKNSDLPFGILWLDNLSKIKLKPPKRGKLKAKTDGNHGNFQTPSYTLQNQDSNFSGNFKFHQNIGTRQYWWFEICMIHGSHNMDAQMFYRIIGEDYVGKENFCIYHWEVLYQKYRGNFNLKKW